jgi:hypothetical protein
MHGDSTEWSRSLDREDADGSFLAQRPSVALADDHHRRGGWAVKLSSALIAIRYEQGVLALVWVTSLPLLFSCIAKNSSDAESSFTNPAVSTTRPAGPGAVATEFRNVDFHVASNVVLHIRRLRGELVPTGPGVPPTFDDRNSFRFRMSSGLFSLAPSDLAGLMNGYTFTYPGAPLQNIRITISGDRLKLEGNLRKGVGIPFQIEGALSATPDGLVRLHSTGIKSGHLPVKGLMDLFGVKLAGLVNLNPSHGVRVEGDDIFLNPNRMLPPPRVEGSVTATKIEDGEVVLVFGSDTGGVSGGLEPLPLPDPGARNYMYFRGGTLRFGKLTMVDSDLEIVDMDPGDPFDFDISQYSRQLTAGYSKTTPSGGLITFMPDLHRLVSINSSSARESRKPKPQMQR